MRLLRTSAFVCALILIVNVGAFAAVRKTPQEIARAVVAKNIAKIDRVINDYIRRTVTVRCEKVKRYLCSDTFELCRDLGGVTGNVLSAQAPISCNNAIAFCAYSETLFSVASKALEDQTKKFPKKVNPLISKLNGLIRDLDRMNAKIAAKIAKRDAYQALCDLDSVKNKSACRNAINKQAEIDKLINVTNPPIIALKQELIAIYTGGIATANAKVNSLIDPGSVPVGTAIRVKNSYSSQKEVICATKASACTTPVPSDSPTPDVSPSPEVTPTLEITPTISPTPTPTSAPLTPTPTASATPLPPTPTISPTPTPFICVPSSDSLSPVVSNLAVVAKAGGQATVSWTTNVAADGIVNWGDLPSYGSNISNFNFATSQSISFPGTKFPALPAGVTKYWMIRVCSNISGNHCTSICAQPVVGLP